MCLDLLRAPLFPRAYSHIENEAIEMRHKYWFEQTSNAISRLSCIIPGISRYTFYGYFITSLRVAQLLWSLHFSPSSSLSIFHNDSPSRSMTFKRFTYTWLIIDILIVKSRLLSSLRGWKKWIHIYRVYHIYKIFIQIYNICISIKGAKCWMVKSNKNK